MEEEAERLEKELEDLYAERDRQPNRSSFKRIVLTISAIAFLPSACGVVFFGPGVILISIAIVLVGSLIVKGMSLSDDKKDVEREIAEKTATLANLRTINRDSEV